jgi:Domain of unknown function (DUF4234)
MEDEMAQVVEFRKGGEGKVRSFAVGAGLTIITLGIYAPCWYYLVNDELRDIGREKDDEGLAQSSPALSVTAIVLGFFYIPWLLSVYNYGNRIKRAQRLNGIPRDQQINPVLAFLLFFPGVILVIPYFVHYWYVTKHQNAAVRATGGLPPWGEPAHLGSGSSSFPPAPPTMAAPEAPEAPAHRGGDPLGR